jgi:hypothetical protein
MKTNPKNLLPPALALAALMLNLAALQRAKI